MVFPVDINRPLKPWDRELSDPAWRKWFDILKDMNVDRIGGSFGHMMTPAQPSEQGVGYSERQYVPAFKGLFGAAPRSQQQQMPERHEQFMKRFGR